MSRDPSTRYDVIIGIKFFWSYGTSLDETELQISYPDEVKLSLVIKVEHSLVIKIRLFV